MPTSHHTAFGWDGTIVSDFVYYGNNTSAVSERTIVRLRSWANVSLLAIFCSPLLAVGHQSPCVLHPTQPGWHVFVENKNRFCFEYPSQYQVAPTVFASGVTTGAATEFLGRLATKPGPEELAVADDEANATIDVFAYGTPFRSDALTRFAPTGMDDIPPKPIHTAHEEFYYYGAGGGVVDYPDAYYFELQGKTFSIHFIGPY